MKNNKLISIVLALLVCLSLVVSVSAANENELVFALESSDSFVETHGAVIAGEGDTFTVSVNITNNPGFLAAIADVNFDSSVLKLENVKCADGVAVNKADNNVRVMIGDLTKAVTGMAEPFTATGSVVELTFKVVASEDKVSPIELTVNNKNVVDLNRTFELPATGAVLNVNAVADNHKCDANKTIDANTGVAATCTEEGKETDLLCAHCAKVVTEGAVIPALGHDFGDGVMTVEPGCTTMGTRTYTCANCGETKVDDKIPAVGHSFGDWTVTKEATVDAEGEETRTCANCQEKETRAIDKLPAPPEKKSNTGLIIAVVVVVVLAGAGVAAYFVLKNKKK